MLKADVRGNSVGDQLDCATRRYTKKKPAIGDKKGQTASFGSTISFY